MPNLWEQLFYIAIIALAMVFGGHLYRKRHDVPASRKNTQGSSAKKRPRKKR